MNFQTERINLYCFFNRTITATSLMIPSCSLTSGSDYFELMWKSPQYRPEIYERTYLCINLLTCLHNCSVADFIRPKVSILHSNSTSFSIRDLRPDSVCVLKLVAVYNPASIDSGIVITSKTLAANKSKRTFGWDFLKNCAWIYIKL